MRANLRFAALGFAAAMGAVASADVLQFTLPTTSVPYAGTTISCTSNVSGIVRAAYLSGGTWTSTAGSAWSREFRAALTSKPVTPGSTLSTLAASTGTTQFTGTNSTAASVLNDPTGSATWNNVGDMQATAVSGNNNRPLFLGGAYFDALGTSTWKFTQQVLASSGQLSNNTKWNYMTDVWSYSGNLSTGSLFTRPSSLTAVSGSGNIYRYNAQTFSVATSGTYLVGTFMNNTDGYAFLYDGAFTATSPLTNIIGLDNDQLRGDGLGGSSSSAMLMNLTAGKTYTLVQSTVNGSTSLTAANGDFQMYVAGGAVRAVPEPGTYLALGLGVVGLIARRRRK